MSNNLKQSLGTEGENLAGKFLEAKGYKILERNFRIGHKEIDVIASKGNLIIFVEVKARKNLAFGQPVLSVDERKQGQIITVAEGYIQQNADEIKNKDFRFDIVTIIYEKSGGPKVEHIEDAFRKR